MVFSNDNMISELSTLFPEQIIILLVGPNLGAGPLSQNSITVLIFTFIFPELCYSVLLDPLLTERQCLK